MILINGNWEDVQDLRDVSRIIREYYSEDLANELDRLIPEHSDIEYDNLLYKLEEKESKNVSLENDISVLEDRIDILEEKIEELTNNC